MKSVTGNMVVDVGKQIFIRRDAKRRRAIVPFDREHATGFDDSEAANGAFVGFDVAIASNSHPSASNTENDAHGNEYGYQLLHLKVVLLWL